MKHRPARLALAFITALSGATAFAVACSNSTTTPTGVVYTAVLSAANEPSLAVASTATGLATLTLRGNDSLDYVVTASNLTAPATLSHIHVGAAGSAGPVVNGFPVVNAVTNGTVTSGTVILSQVVVGPGQVSGDSVRVLLLNGNGYVNVHTSNNKPGEIRGQIVRQ